MRLSKQLGWLGIVAAFTGSCRPQDEPTSPNAGRPPTANVCPVDYFCGTADGLIHDGTGNGTLVIVPGDPSPGADGIWLGNFVSPNYCYNNLNPYVRYQDNDHDWLEDECEYQLAKAFAPALAIHPNDNCPGGEPYWAARYTPDEYGRPIVRIAYMPAYYKDCGPNSFPGTPVGHDGDSEFFMLGLEFNPATRHWEVYEAFLSAHHGTGNQGSIYTRSPLSLEYPAHPLSYPRVWVAQAKHANYRSLSQCNSGGNLPFGNDNCTGNVTVGRMKVYKNYNVGSEAVDYFVTGVLSKNPLFMGPYQREWFYNPHNFGGWQPNLPTGVTPYATFLLGPYFDCWDPDLIPGGVMMCNNPDPNTVPATTTLLGIVTGPTSVTAYQSYTFGSFVTGGTDPYRAEWWRKYANESAATLAGNSTGGYTMSNPTAGSFTMTVDRCQGFTLTLKIWSTDNQFKSYNYPVALASCPPPPPPPLSLSISGPVSISSKATYTYAAVASGFTAPTYAWSERICHGTSCPGWSSLTGYTTTVPRVLTPDCSGTGIHSYNIRLTMTSSDGRTATATASTSLCASANPPL